MKSHWILAPGAASCLCAAALPAQLPDVLSRIPVTAVISIGSPAEDRVRLDQLRGARSAEGWLLRSTALLTPPLEGKGIRVGGDRGCGLSLVSPSTALTWNSRLPFERNDAGMWSGRGVGAQLSGGVLGECGRLRFVIAPDLWYAQNRAFALVTRPSEGRSSFLNPFYAGREASGDLPLRFGSRAMLVVQPGQTAAELDAGYVTVGAGTQSQWWGPGIRNGLVMSNHAAGIPSAYARTTRPLRSRFGAAEARWMVGALTESPFFDVDARNDIRSMSGLVVTFAPAFDTTLTLGAARVVYAPVGSGSEVLARFFDVVTRWGPVDNVPRSAGEPGDQLTSLFARWLFPSSGFEGYAEWARVVLPSSLRSFLLAPQYSQGYTVGTQWLSTADTARAAWRAQLELTMLEQPRFDAPEEPPAFYLSPIGGQGYTQRGRVIGAMIGPGGSSQFIAVDNVRRSWSLGGMLGRIRWNNEQYYRQPTGRLGLAHDVTVFSGLRGSRALRAYDFSAELIAEKRLNFMFQSMVSGYGEDHTFDVTNTSLRFSLTPR